MGGDAMIKCSASSCKVGGHTVSYTFVNFEPQNNEYLIYVINVNL